MSKRNQDLCPYTAYSKGRDRQTYNSMLECGKRNVARKKRRGKSDCGRMGTGDRILHRIIKVGPSEENAGEKLNRGEGISNIIYIPNDSIIQIL